MRNDNERSANQTLRAALNEAMAAGRIKSFGGPWAVWGSTIRPGFVSVNATRAEAADVTDPVQIAAATERMRREIPAIVDVMRQADPAFRNAWLAQTATVSGFRECREIKALHRVTAAEFASGADVPDAIALAARRNARTSSPPADWSRRNRPRSPPCACRRSAWPWDRRQER